MTYQQGQPNLPPWFAHLEPPSKSTCYPPMEPLAPNPRLVNQQPPAAQPEARKRQTRPGPQARRATKREIHTRLAQATQEQPRDAIGRFAEKGKGNFLSRLLDPTPRVPTRLKPLSPARRQHRATAPPRARSSKRRRKKPVPERSFFGRFFALFNGDYTRWKRAELRQRARLRMQAEGFAPLPKRRRRKKSRQARRMSRRDTQGRIPGREASLQALAGE